VSVDPYPVLSPALLREDTSAGVAEYRQHTEREDGSHAGIFAVISCTGTRLYVADDLEHAAEQHRDGFPDEGEPYAVVEVDAGPVPA